jgi:hypothetical protein
MDLLSNCTRGHHGRSHLLVVWVDKANHIIWCSPKW